MDITTRKYTCCLCGKEFEGHGNNPYPLVGKECCTACDCIYVNPIRNYINNIKRKKQVFTYKMLVSISDYFGGLKKSPKSRKKPEIYSQLTMQ